MTVDEDVDAGKKLDGERILEDHGKFDAWMRVYGKTPATFEWVFDWILTLTKPMTKFMREMDSHNAMRNDKIAQLEAKVAALEQRPELHDAGPWKSGETYKPGAIVSHGGSGWVCRALTGGVHFDHAAFRLLVQRGRDGRDFSKDANPR